VLALVVYGVLFWFKKHNKVSITLDIHAEKSLSKTLGAWHTRTHRQRQAQAQAQTHRHRHPDTQTLKHPDTKIPRYLYTQTIHKHTHTHAIARIAAERAESYRDVNFEGFQQRPQSAAYTCQYSHACMQSAMQKRETVGDVEGALN